jgi:hypothetical protein
VTRAGDDVPEMFPTPLLDDHAIEAIICGDDVPTELNGLATFASRIRDAGEGRPPRPSPALAHLLDQGLRGAPSGSAATPTQRFATRRRSTVAKVAGLSIVAKVAIGATAAAAGVVGAGAVGVLPGDSGQVVRDAIEVVTPVEFTDHDDRRDPVAGDRDERLDGVAGDHGERVSSDATGESDGEPGVEGREISQDAPGASQRPTDGPRQPGTPGSPAEPGSQPHPEPGQPDEPEPPTGPGPSTGQAGPGEPGAATSEAPDSDSTAGTPAP